MGAASGVCLGVSCPPLPYARYVAGKSEGAGGCTRATDPTRIYPAQLTRPARPTHSARPTHPKRVEKSKDALSDAAKGAGRYSIYKVFPFHGNAPFPPRSEQCASLRRQRETRQCHSLPSVTFENGDGPRRRCPPLSAVCPRSEVPFAPRIPKPFSVKLIPLRTSRPIPSCSIQLINPVSTPPCRIKSSIRCPISLSASALITAVFSPKHLRNPRATLYSPPPSQALNCRAVRTRPSPGSRRSMISPRETSAYAQLEGDLISSAIGAAEIAFQFML